MKRSNMSTCLSVALGAFLMMPISVLAAEEAEPNIADVWFVVPKDGQSDKFEEALKTHLQYRKDQGDVRAWKTYVPVVGDELGFYVIRYCCVNYADMDSYRDWGEDKKIIEHWNANADQYVAEYRHHFSDIDMENSNWPEDDSGYRYFGVTNWQPKPGKGRTINGLKKEFSDIAKEGGWGRHWGWSSPVGGDPGLTIVTPYENYAAMAPLEQSFFEFAVEQVGSEVEVQRMFDQFGTSFHGSTYTIYALVDDLSMEE